MGELGRVKWRKIDLPQRVFGDFRAVVLPSALGGALADVVLGTGSDAVRRIEALALIATHISGRHR